MKLSEDLSEFKTGNDSQFLAKLTKSIFHKHLDAFICKDKCGSSCFLDHFCSSGISGTQVLVFAYAFLISKFLLV
jgi:hypothetical protein